MAVSQVEESLFFPLGFHTLHNWTLSPVLFQTLPIYPPHLTSQGARNLLPFSPGPPRCLPRNDRYNYNPKSWTFGVCVCPFLSVISFTKFFLVFVFTVSFQSGGENFKMAGFKLKRRPINATTSRIPMRERIPSVQDPNSLVLTISRSRKNLDKISFYSPRKEKGNFPIFVSPNNCQHGINQLRRLIPPPPPTRLSEIPGPVVVLQYLQVEI